MSRLHCLLLEIRDLYQRYTLLLRFCSIMLPLVDWASFVCHRSMDFAWYPQLLRQPPR